MVSISACPGAYGCAQAECWPASQRRHLTASSRSRPSRHCAISGGGLRRPAETSTCSNQTETGRQRPPLGGFLGAPGVSAGVPRSARGLKVKPSATRCATRSAGALSEIRNDRWTIDIRRRKKSDLVPNYIPIGRNRRPVKFVQADATPVFRRETTVSLTESIK